MFRRAGETEFQAFMRNSSEQAMERLRQQQLDFQRRGAAAWWLEQQKKKNNLLLNNPLTRRQSWSTRAPLGVQPIVKPKARLLPRASAAIERTWPEYNVEQDGQRGMCVHVTYSVANLLGRTGTAVAHFYFDSGVPLRDFNNQYRTKAGKVCAARAFTPAYANARYDDLVLFMPYFELHMRAGNHDLKFSTSVWDDQDRELARSGYYEFTLQAA